MSFVAYFNILHYVFLKLKKFRFKFAVKKSSSANKEAFATKRHFYCIWRMRHVYGTSKLAKIFFSRNTMMLIQEVYKQQRPHLYLKNSKTNGYLL